MEGPLPSERMSVLSGSSLILRTAAQLGGTLLEELTLRPQLLFLLLLDLPPGLRERDASRLPPFPAAAFPPPGDGLLSFLSPPPLRAEERTSSSRPADLDLEGFPRRIFSPPLRGERSLPRPPDLDEYEL